MLISTELDDKDTTMQLLGVGLPKRVGRIDHECFQFAIKDGRLDIIKKLLDWGVDPSLVIPEPITEASHSLFLSAVEPVITAGGAKRTSGFGNTPMHYLCSH